MGNETDLDWLARNVHVWPNQGFAFQIGHEHFKQEGLFFRDCFTFDIGFVQYLIARDQWLVRRAELQNKPSWKDAPEWATHLVQITTGSWIWIDDGRLEIKLESVDKLEYSGSYGMVLGDWRDTLERRPESTRAEMEVELVKAAFKPFTSIEDNQGQGMKQDNGWFGRGELPPVGCLCLYVVSDRLSAEVEITAHAKFGLCFVEVGKSGESYVSKTAELHRFRPIRADRDVLIDIIVSQGFLSRDGTVSGEIADAILAAGFRMGAK